MKRFVLDILVILMVVSIVSVLASDDQSVSIDEDLRSFESQIENGYVYETNKNVYLLQVEENQAGKLGDALSTFVVSIIQESVDIVKEIMEVF